MRESLIYQKVRSWLMQECPKRGLPAAAFMERFQPLHQGRPDGLTVYWHKVTGYRVGSAQVEYDGSGAALVRTETQSMRLTLQFTCTQPVDISADALTQGDVLAIVAASLQGQDAVAYFVSQGLSVERVTEIRNIYVNNDRDQNEPNPSFDIAIKHNDVYVDGPPQVDRATVDVIAVPNLADA